MVARMLFRPHALAAHKAAQGEREELRAWIDNDHKAEGYSVAFARVRIGVLFIYSGAYWRKEFTTLAREIPQTSTYPHKYRDRGIEEFRPTDAVMVTTHDHIDFTLPAFPKLTGSDAPRSPRRREAGEDVCEPMSISCGPSANWQAYWSVRLGDGDPWGDIRREVGAKPIHVPRDAADIGCGPLEAYLPSPDTTKDMQRRLKRSRST